MGAFQLTILYLFIISIISVNSNPILVGNGQFVLTPADTELARFGDCAPALHHTYPIPHNEPTPVIVESHPLPPAPLEYAPHPLPVPFPAPEPNPVPLPTPFMEHPVDDCIKELPAPLPLPVLPPQPALPPLPPTPPFQIEMPEVYAEPELPLLPAQPPFQAEVPVEADPIIPAPAPQPCFEAQPAPPYIQFDLPPPPEHDCTNEIPLAAPIPLPAPQPLPELPPLAPLPPMPPFQHEPEHFAKVDCFHPTLPEKFIPEAPTAFVPPPPPPQQFTPGCPEHDFIVGQPIAPPVHQFLPPPQFTPTYPEKGFIVGDAIAPPPPPPAIAPPLAPGAYPPHHFVADHDCHTDISPSPEAVPGSEFAYRAKHRSGISHPLFQ